MTKKEEVKMGRPTKYSKELAEKIALELTHSTLDKVCKNVGIHEDTYYEWLYRYPDFSALSTLARKTKAVHHFTECQKVLEDTRKARKEGNINYRSDLARLECDFHLRLAGKANQGLFGDSLKVDSETPLNPVVNLTLNR